MPMFKLFNQRTHIKSLFRYYYYIIGVSVKNFIRAHSKFPHTTHYNTIPTVSRVLKDVESRVAKKHMLLI